MCGWCCVCETVHVCLTCDGATAYTKGGRADEAFFLMRVF